MYAESLISRLRERLALLLAFCISTYQLRIVMCLCQLCGALVDNFVGHILALHRPVEIFFQRLLSPQPRQNKTPIENVSSERAYTKQGP